MLEQQLHPQAQPEHGKPVGRDLAQAGVESAAPQPLHRFPERADAWQHESVELAQQIGVVDGDDTGADVLERLDDRAPIPEPDVDEPDPRRARRGAQSTPFVEGTPLSRGSIATA